MVNIVVKLLTCINTLRTLRQTALIAANFSTAMVFCLEIGTKEAIPENRHTKLALQDPDYGIVRLETQYFSVYNNPSVANAGHKKDHIISVVCLSRYLLSCMCLHWGCYGFIRL